MANEQINYREAIETPIPERVGIVKGWEEKPIQESGQRLVALGTFSPEDINDYREIATGSIYAGERIDSPYFNNPLNNSLIGMFLRKDAADVVVQAQQIAPPGVYLILRDCYRDLSLQQSLYDFYFNQLKNLHPDWDDESLAQHTKDYVSPPSYNPQVPSPHNTGGAIDLELIKVPLLIDQRIKQINARLRQLTDGNDRNQVAEAYHLEMEKSNYFNDLARSLNFGTPFDYGKIEAKLRWFEELERPLTQREIVERGNRRLLYWIMTQAGAQPFSSEWWHFNVGNQMAAASAQASAAIYGRAELSPENLDHEAVRVNHRLGNMRIYRGEYSKFGSINTAAFSVVLRNAHESDYTLTSLKRADIISPTTH